MTSALGEAGFAALFWGACKKDSDTSPEVDTAKPLNAFACAAPAKGTNYSICPLGSGGAGVGYPMLSYDAATSTIFSEI